MEKHLINQMMNKINKEISILTLIANMGMVKIYAHFEGGGDSGWIDTVSIIKHENNKEVYINASIETCEDRDVKGLYQKARNGEIKDFTGISAPFEAPKNPNLEINTSELSIDESVQKVLDYILPIIKNK